MLAQNELMAMIKFCSRGLRRIFEQIQKHQISKLKILQNLYHKNLKIFSYDLK
jgi:hypothetical protein